MGSVAHINQAVGYRSRSFKNPSAPARLQPAAARSSVGNVQEKGIGGGLQGAWGGQEHRVQVGKEVEYLQSSCFACFRWSGHKVGQGSSRVFSSESKMEAVVSYHEIGLNKTCKRSVSYDMNGLIWLFGCIGSRLYDIIDLYD